MNNLLAAILAIVLGVCLVFGIGYIVNLPHDHPYTGQDLVFDSAPAIVREWTLQILATPEVKIPAPDCVITVEMTCDRYGGKGQDIACTLPWNDWDDLHEIMDEECGVSE